MEPPTSTSKSVSCCPQYSWIETNATLVPNRSPALTAGITMTGCMTTIAAMHWLLPLTSWLLAIWLFFVPIVIVWSWISLWLVSWRRKNKQSLHYRIWAERDNENWYFVASVNNKITLRILWKFVQDFRHETTICGDRDDRLRHDIVLISVFNSRTVISSSFSNKAVTRERVRMLIERFGLSNRLRHLDGSAHAAQRSVTTATLSMMQPAFENWL
jgi:hypothetical protein